MSSRYASGDSNAYDADLNCSDSRQEEAASNPEISVFDVDTLIMRLEQYKTSLEETEAYMRRQRRRALSAEDAEDVAAAERFRQEIETNIGQSQPLSPDLVAAARFREEIERNGGFSQPLSPVAATMRAPHGPGLDSHPVHFPTRSTSLARRRKSATSVRSVSTLSGPLQSLEKQESTSHLQRSQTATTAKARPRPINVTGSNTDLKRGAVYGSVPNHQPSLTVMEAHASLSSTVVSTPNQFFQFFPDTPSTLVSSSSSSQSHKTGVTPLHDGLLPQRGDDILTMGSPNEDQIRREIESLAITEGANLLEQSKRYHNGGWRTPVVHAFEFEEQGERKVMSPSKTSQSTQDSLNGKGSDALSGTQGPEEDPSKSKPKLRRKFSIFKMLSRKSDTDKLIELYMNDEQLEECKAPKKKPPKLARTWTVGRMDEPQV